MIYSKYFDMTCRKLGKLLNVYSNLVYRKIGDLQNCRGLKTTEHLRLPPTQGLFPLEAGMHWGGEWGNLWVVGTASFPEAVKGKVYMVPHTDAVETLCFVNGKPTGMINSKGDNIINGLHYASFIAEDIPAGASYEIGLDCYAWHDGGGLMPYDRYGSNGPAPEEFDMVYHGVDIAVLDEEVYGFVFDLDNILQIAKVKEEGSGLYARASRVLEQVLAEVVQYPADVAEDVWRAAMLRCRTIMAEIYDREEQTEENGYVGLIGHSHMDTAWRWPVKETIRKCARTYANVLTLMDQDPQYRFIQSSALHLDWMRRYYPDIFEGIAKRVAEGRYEPNGAVWVECDCNLTSGELMVRHFLYGQRFTRKYLNYTADCFWLPDTFGYNAAIPQIMRGSEVKYFYTTKLSWGDLNVFPRDTFRWRGMDGSEVLTHLNIIQARPDVEDLTNAMKTVKDPAMFNGKLVAFGYGDGGGGPTPGMLEDFKRVRRIKGMPKVEYTTASGFLKKVEKEAHSLAVYDGELYVEVHRGTLTMMHDIKRNNRQCENALHTMDYLHALAGGEDKEQTDELYKTLLTNQFHDILPGTSLECVNVLAKQEVTAVRDTARSLAKARLESLTDGDRTCLSVFNPAPYSRNAFCMELTEGLEGVCSQTYTDVTGKTVTYVYGVQLPAYGSRSFRKGVPAAAAENPFRYDGDTLETPFYSVRFGADGAITSMVDKAVDRQIVSGTPLNTFYMGEDVPEEWDNWNIDNDQAAKMHTDMRLQSRELVSSGALLLAIRSTYRIGLHSAITQDMIFYANERRVDFHTVIDWNDKHQLLKVDFDVDVFTNTMKNEIQFGYMERPLTRNHSVEAAMFEVANHKWTDVSDNRYGVAVLNDCKYGISGLKNDVGGVDLQLTLMKSGTKPDTTGDAGVHELCYSLLPHIGSFDAAVVAEGYRLNVPVCLADGRAELAALAAVDADNVVIETVKPSEDVENAYVVRLYEAERSKTNCRLSLVGAKKVYATNLLEDIQEEPPLVNGTVSLTFRPFEIKTVLVER